MAVSSQVIHDNPAFAVVKYTNDGATAENAAPVVKLDISQLTGGATKANLEWVVASVMPPNEKVAIAYDGDTPALIWEVNSTTGFLDFSKFGGAIPNNATVPTGDITFQTSVAGVSYSILLKVNKG